MLSWPRGKYNGRRIEGFEINIAIHVLSWRLKSFFDWNFGQPVFIWLCFTLRLYCKYEYRSNTSYCQERKDNARTAV